MVVGLNGTRIRELKVVEKPAGISQLSALPVEDEEATPTEVREVGVR
jgi:hypothetical protein